MRGLAFGDRIAYLFLTDKQTEAVLNNFTRIRSALTPPDHAAILFHRKEQILSESLKAHSPFLFTNQTLLDLRYMPIARNIVPGSNHFPILQYFLAFPEYKYYWVIEDDVYFNGEWKYLFDSFNGSDHDFISSHLRTFLQDPGWVWWHSLSHRTKCIAVEKRIASFNPIYRISGRALGFIHDALSDKWIGHHEVLLPSLLFSNGFTILDFGGHGNFVAKGGEDRFYTSDIPGSTGSTLRFRPVWQAPGDLRNKLYHPVK